MSSKKKDEQAKLLNFHFCLDGKYLTHVFHFIDLFCKFCVRSFQEILANFYSFMGDGTVRINTV